MELAIFIIAMRGKPWTFRMKILREDPVDEWSNWLIAPADTYLETEKQGSYSIKQIEWIDINPVEVKTTGRLVPVTQTDHSNEIMSMLQSHAIDYKKVDTTFRLFISGDHSA